VKPKRVDKRRKGLKPGRPTLYNPETIKILCAAYSTGIGLTDSALAAGVSVETARAWRRESKANPDGPKGRFYPMLREALAQSILRASDEIKRTDQRWWLSRMRPKRWGDPAKRVELSGKLDVTAGVRQGQFEADIDRILKLKPHVPGAVEVVDEPGEDGE